jgi:putative FmdB family regulatory protein
MPIYEYRCDRGHTFETLQSMNDEPLTSCSTCGDPVQRVFHPVAVHFKGSGFYTTDYASKKAAGKSDSNGKPEGAKETTSSSDTSSKSGQGDSKPSG